MTSSRYAITALLTIGLLAASSTAMADDTQLYDWPAGDAPVLVQNDSGVLLIGPDAKPLRALSWDANDGDLDQPVRLVDMTGDNTPNIVGSGNPTFITDATGVPELSLNDGCDQVVVDEFRQFSGLGMVCVDGSDISLYGGDGSRAWSLGAGRNIDFCHTGDLTNNTENDIECKYRGRDQYIRIRPDGDVIDSSAETQGLEQPGEDLTETMPVDAVAGTGDVFSIDGNTITVSVDDEITSVDADADIDAAFVKNFPEAESEFLVALAGHRLHLVSDDGQTVYDYSTDTSDYSRVPHADYYALNVNGFEDNDAVRELVRDIQDDISQCYGDRMRSAPFAGSGRYIVQLFVGEDGSIQQLTPRTNRVNDDQIESCTQDAVRSIDFPGADSGRAIVNLNLVFTFVDEEE